MQTGKKTQVRAARLAFEALSIEGGLLSPEWLAKMAQLKAEHQSESDYGISKGLTLRDEIGRYWRVAQAHWKDFAAGREKNANPKALAENFIKGLLKESFCFSSLKATEPAVVAERSYPMGTAALEGRVPVVIAPAGSGLDTLSPSFGDGVRRRSAFGLAQEYLNAEDKALWGLASDGVTLRVLRDNASMTRPTWLEADLERIFKEERYADFAALWLLVHETRFGRAEQPPTECALEKWRESGRQEGTRARDKLRYGFEEALVALGQGFLSHPENQALRASLQNGTLTKEEFYRQLLRLVYRLIFVLTIEERGLLHLESTSNEIKKLYEDGYSLRRLRERSVKRSAHDRFSDLWEATKIVFLGLARGEPRLGLPALSGLFSLKRCPDIDKAKLENRSLLMGVFRLSWLREPSGLSRVNWRDMGPEELGSVYESLLELVPQITQDGRSFKFASGGETKGNARKTSGSYYTPDSLVQVLLDSALEPVIADTIKANPDKPVEALLNLSIVDPACGSGHFLLGAARRLAVHVARLQANGTPSAAEYRHALRQVISKCLYGVDINPMAVELCQVSLWLEAMEVGPPMTFLDSHIQCGNSLLGTTPELMAKGIPDVAWEPIEGDDKKIASALKKRNKKSTEGQLGFVLSTPSDETKSIAREMDDLEAASDTDIDSRELKESNWDNLKVSQKYQRLKFIADAWCAAFVWPKQPGLLADAAPVNEVWQRFKNGAKASPLTEKITNELVRQYLFFHWHLAFPKVFAKGGFDTVLGNPPWDSLLFREEEFFAGPRPDIAQASTAALRKQMIAKLSTEDPNLFRRYQQELRAVEGANAFVRSGVRYPLCGVGRVNLFALFAEAARTLVSKIGRVGQILPSGIVTDDSTKLFFQAIINSDQLISFVDFENREGIFPSVHRSFKFGILVFSGSPQHKTAEFIFFATRVEHLKEAERRFSLSKDDIALLNPLTRNCPIFRSRHEADIGRTAYLHLPILAHSSWDLRTTRILNSADDSGGFVEHDGVGLIPLYEAKYFHLFDHRWLTIDNGKERVLSDEERNPDTKVTPRFWFSEREASARIKEIWSRPWVLAWRRIARSTDERTFIAAVIPSVAVPHTARVMLLPELNISLAPVLLANVNSLVFDWFARRKVGGTDVSDFIVSQLPVLSPECLKNEPSWGASADHPDIMGWVSCRVLELTYNSWDLEPFAHDAGYNGPPFRWKPERRLDLRAELDAAFFHLYGIKRDDAAYIMDTFPIVRKNDEKAHGTYRTKEIILEIYDEMAEATRTGKPYQTRLNPPPADPRVAHPPRTKEPTLAPIIPFPKTKPTPQIPQWGPGVIEIVAKKYPNLGGDGSWSTSLTGEYVGVAALAAVLRQLSSPQPRENIEDAVILALLPGLVHSCLVKSDATEWKRLIGGTELKRTSLNSLKIPWQIVVRDAIHQRILAHNGDSWGPGEDVENPSNLELDARAKVALSYVLSKASGIDISQHRGILNVS